MAKESPTTNLTSLTKVTVVVTVTQEVDTVAVATAETTTTEAMITPLEVVQSQETQFGIVMLTLEAMISHIPTKTQTG